MSNNKTKKKIVKLSNALQRKANMSKAEEHDGRVYRHDSEWNKIYKLCQLSGGAWRWMGYHNMVHWLASSLIGMVDVVQILINANTTY